MNTSEMIAKAKETIRREGLAVQQAADQIDERIVEIVDVLFQCKGHILVTGTGTSRFVAERMAHLLNCCGTPSMYINAADSLHGGAGTVTEMEVVVIISKGGQSSEINQFAHIAKSRGAKLIALSEKTDSPLAKLCDCIYQIKAPEAVDPFGMIATGSSLVNCAAADALCILLLERRGYSKEDFAKTHPSGAVGIKLENEGLHK